MLKIKKTFLIIVALFLPIFSVLAQQLEKIPGQTSVGDSDLIGYLNNLYKFGISITGILAVFMIAVGAFSYIVTSAGNPSKMSDAKSKITNALIGLTIALTAYLFLYVINPDLVGGTLKAPEFVMNGSSNTQFFPETERTLIDGTECDDGSESPLCTSCESCAKCKNGYMLNALGNKHICGQPDGDVIGCCITDGSDENGCSVITKNKCDSISGGHFTSIGNQCVNKARWIGFYWGCEKIPPLESGDKCSLKQGGVLGSTINPTAPECIYCPDYDSSDNTGIEISNKNGETVNATCE